MWSSDSRARCLCTDWGMHSQGEKVERGEGSAWLCIWWVRAGPDAASWLEKGCEKIGESSGIWETAFEWEAVAGPCLFSLSQARLGCDSIAVSTYLHGEGISFNQKHVMKPSSRGLDQDSHCSRNSPVELSSPHPAQPRNSPQPPYSQGPFPQVLWCSAGFLTPGPGVKGFMPESSSSCRKPLGRFPS